VIVVTKLSSTNITSWNTQDFTLARNPSNATNALKSFLTVDPTVNIKITDSLAAVLVMLQTLLQYLTAVSMILIRAALQ